MNSETTGQVMALKMGLSSLRERSDAELQQLQTIVRSGERKTRIACDALRRLRSRRVAAIPYGARRILIVDDDKLFLNALRRMLLEDVADLVEPATSVRTARLKIEEANKENRPFDAMVLDYGLANGTAADIVASARFHPKSRHAWVVLISGRGWTHEEGLVHAARIGANDFAAKPITNIEEFQRQVLRAFKSSPRHVPMMQFNKPRT